MSLTYQDANLLEPDTAQVSSTPNWKRVLDFTVCLLAIPLLVPLCTFISIAIKILSPGPILFTQERTGKNEDNERIERHPIISKARDQRAEADKN